MIGTYLTGDAEVIRKVDELGSRMRKELRGGIGRLALKLQNKVKTDKLSGQVLNVRTGRLRRSINQAVIDEGEKVTGVVSTAVKYAPPHEYGFSGVVTVREHLRMQTKAWGKAITPKQVTVRSHSAKMNLPARSFLRSALHDMDSAGTIKVELEAAVARALS